MVEGAGVMNRRRPGVLTLCAVLLAGGCGVVGSPIPPENVGVAPLIEQQKQQHAQQAESAQPDAPLVVEPKGQDEELPPLRPIGTR
jgi:hypothetical protein